MRCDWDLHNSSSRIASEALRQLHRAESDPGFEPGSMEDLKRAAIAELAAMLDADGQAISLT
jgi:hypothetical protein